MSKFSGWKSAVAAAAAVVACAGTSATQAATHLTLETESAWNGTDIAGPFGEPNTATYGQTFIVPTGYNALQSFTFHLRERAPGTHLDFAAYIMAWDGAGATGDVLFDSGKITTTDNAGAGGFEAIDVATGGLTLVEGGSYVAFFSASDYFQFGSHESLVDFGRTADDAAYALGDFVYMNNGGDRSLLTRVDWKNNLPYDLAFEMTFAVVPLPTSAWLTLSLLAALGTMRLARRRRTGAG